MVVLRHRGAAHAAPHPIFVLNSLDADISVIDPVSFKQVKRIVTHSKQAACVTAERKTDKLLRDKQLTRARLRMEMMAVKTMARAFFKDDGLKVLRAALQKNPWTQVIVLTAYGTVETAVEAMKEGAYDFITKPLKRAHVVRVVGKALEKQFEEYLAFNSSLTLYYNPTLKLYSRPDETEAAFQRRRRQEAVAERALDDLDDVGLRHGRWSSFM